MTRFTLKQRIFIVKNYYQLGNSTKNVQNAFREDFHSSPSDNHIIELVNLFEEFGNVLISKQNIENDLAELLTEKISAPEDENQLFQIKNTILMENEPMNVVYQPDEESSEEYDDELELSDEDEVVLKEKLLHERLMSAEPKILSEAKKFKNLGSKVKLLLKCDVCDKTFNRRARFDRHMSAHKNTCQVCRKRVRDLKVHMRRHTGEKSYQCSQCGVQFHRYDRLRCHMVSHSDERPFQCETCSKAFKTRKHLHEHAKTHLSAEDRPIKCDVCGKGFLYKVDLKKHSRIHTGEKPSLCIVCGKSFASNEILKVHKRIHTGEKPYQCPYCDEKFSRFGSLHTHKRIHTGEKPYKCSYCEKAFYDSGSRRSHEHIHIGDFPYKCLLCDKAYNHLSSLKSHMNYTHRDSQTNENN